MTPVIALIDAAAKTTSKSSSFLTLLLPLLLIYGVIWYFFLRPRNQRARAQRSQGRQFEVGDQVQTIGGLIATVVEIDDRTVTLRVESGQEMKFLKAAIAQKYVEPTEADEGETSADHGGASDGDHPNGDGDSHGADGGAH
jgi:preprotein translocase subunit YajC